MRRLLVTAAILWCLVFSSPAFAQSVNATLGGTVSDATGALLPGVTVTATNTGTGVVTTVTSNETGAYQFPPLQPGTYKASAELPSFQTQIYNNVVLGISQQVRLNFSLQVASQAQAVEVNVAADTLIATTSASVGTVLPEYKLRDLPLADRDITDLINAMPGVQGTNVAGAPTGFTMTTRDGIPVSQGRYNVGAFTQTAVSPDLVDEVRIIVAPADAEYGRGSAQLQMLTRSGTNEFKGSLFWSNRNSVWDANTFSNNFNRVGKNFLNRNQFGGRIGGPIVKNKTFFFTLIEAQRAVQKQIIFPIVLTQQARQGIFRYYPGIQNAGATAAVPTVELDGSPRQSLGTPVSFNVFGPDPNRPGPDPSGLIKRTILDPMPLPNNFEAFNGVDGLNTARYRWSRRQFGSDTLSGGSQGDLSNRTQVNVKFDHHFNPNNRLSVAVTREQSFSDLSLSEWPGGFNGQIQQHPRVFTSSFVSTISPTMVNEVRFGMRRGRLEALQAFDHPKTGAQAREYMGKSGAIPWTIEGTLFGQSSMVFADNGSIGNATPLWNYGDNISWIRGKHALKAGADFRYQRGNAWNSDEIVPAVHLGPSPWPGPNGVLGFGPGGLIAREYYCFCGGIPVQGLDTGSMPGVNATDLERARALLTDLNGSVANISQGFSLRPDPKNIKWLDYSQYYQKYRDFHQNEWSWFFKDDWKIRPDLTINLGVRYEWFGVPYEGQGMMATAVGGSDGIFGVSGNSFADWMKPGVRGQLTTMEFVGKHSPQPNKKLYNDDWNNFAPAIGFSWSLPWGGKDKTVLRAGYGIAYGGLFAAGGGLNVDLFIGLAPSTNQFANHPITSLSEMSLSSIKIPIPERNPDGALPVIPLTERNQSLAVYDKNRVTPYIQNLNVELQRTIAKDLTVEVRYIGSKGSKLEALLQLGNPIIEENGLLEAFKQTQQGLDAPIFDRMLNGITIQGVGTIGTNNLTGSQALRLYSRTRPMLANNQVRDFANFLNTDATLAAGVGDNKPGGLLRRANLPDNFIVTNPQFGGTAFGIAGTAIGGNLLNSTYHSMQAAVTKRLSQGFTNQTTYTWSRAIGTSINDMRNRNNKSLQTFHRTNDIRTNGTYELPFGPNRQLLSGAPGWVSRIVERWQLGGIFSWTSGSPLSFVAGPSPYLLIGNSNNYPDLVGEFPKNSGEVKILAAPGRITYFDGFTRVVDTAARAGITTAQTLNTAATGLFAIQDPQGRVVMSNAATGKVGNMGQNWIEGPGAYRLDANLIKRVKVSEKKEFEVRLDAINILNHPTFGNPNVDINSANFGVIALPTTGNRTFTFNARLNF